MSVRVQPPGALRTASIRPTVSVFCWKLSQRDIKKYRHEHFWRFWITECVIWSFLIQECMSSDRVEREVFQIGYLPLQRGISNLRHSYSSSRSLAERISMALVIKIKTFQEHLLMQTRIIQNHHVTNKNK